MEMKPVSFFTSKTKTKLSLPSKQQSLKLLQTCSYYVCTLDKLKLALYGAFLFALVVSTSCCCCLLEGEQQHTVWAKFLILPFSHYLYGLCGGVNIHPTINTTLIQLFGKKERSLNQTN